MRQKSGHAESSSERIVKDIRRATRKRHSAEEKIRIVLDTYRVSVFKDLVGVPLEKELDQIIKGVIEPLDDGATIVIASGEKFISHERTGAAS